MKTIDRRRLVRGLLCGAVAASGLAMTLGATEAMPFDTRVLSSSDDLIEKAQVVVVNPRGPPRRHPPPLAVLVASRSARLWLALTLNAGLGPSYPLVA